MDKVKPAAPSTGAAFFMRVVFVCFVRDIVASSISSSMLRVPCGKVYAVKTRRARLAALSIEHEREFPSQPVHCNATSA